MATKKRSTPDVRRAPATPAVEIAAPAEVSAAAAPAVVTPVNTLAEGKITKPYQQCRVLKDATALGVLLRKGTTVVIGKRMTIEAWRQNAVQVIEETDE